MFIRISQFLAAPVFEDEEKTRVASLLNIIVQTTIVVSLGLGLYFGLATPVGSELLPQALAEASVGILSGLIPWFLMRRGYVRVASLVFSALLGALLLFMAFESGGIRAHEYASLVLMPVIAGLLLGGRAAFVAAGLSMLAGLGMMYLEANGLLWTRFDPADYTMLDIWVSRSIDFALVAVLLYLTSRGVRENIERARHSKHALIEANRDLETNQALLQERTHDLEQRSRYLEASAKVSHAASSILELDQLTRQVVELIREEFGLYHVGLFLLNETGRWAEYRAGDGEIGRILAEQGLHLEVGGRSVIGRCMADAQVCVAQGMPTQTEHIDHPLLADIRSEAGLPLIARGRVIGALSVQSDRVDTFDQDTVAVLQTLAEQVAVALDNARLYAESRAALEAERRAYGDISREAWADMLRGGLAPGYRYVGKEIVPIGDVWHPEMEAALQEEQSVVASTADNGHVSPAFAVPIKVRGQVIGVVDVHKPSDAGRWTAEELALMETLTEQLSVALESARLYEDTQRRAARERLAGEVTTRMRETLDLETVLSTAASEMRQALDLDKVVVRLAMKEADSDSV